MNIMSERITKCDECESVDFTVTNTEKRKGVSPFIVVMEAKCNLCENIFEFPTLSEIGKQAKRSGRIW